LVKTPILTYKASFNGGDITIKAEGLMENAKKPDSQVTITGPNGLS